MYHDYSLFFILFVHKYYREAMSFSSWLCTKSTKSMLVKIVHPGGHVELHDCTILAAELMHRNPRCCVAYPHIFKQPWAIVSPDTMLQLGQKYYVVPISTIRKLQRHSLKYSPTSTQECESKITSPCKEEEVDHQDMVKTCWFFMNKNSPKLPYACLGHSSSDQKNEEKGCFQSNYCFVCLLMKTKISGDDSKEEAKSSPSTSASTSSSETKGLTRKRVGRDFTRIGVKGTPKRLTSLDNWHPNLESITEE